MVVGALDTECGGNKLTHQSVANGHIVAARMVAFGEYVDDGTASAMKARDYKDATDLVAQSSPIAAYAIQGSMIGRNDNAGPQGDGINEEVCFTQNTIDRHAVAQPIPFDTTQITSPSNYSKPQFGDPCHPLAAGAHPPAVAQPIVLMDQGGGVMNIEHDMTGTLRRETHGHEPVIVSPTLTAANDPSRSPQSTEVTNQVAAVHSVSMAVRRLTPIECERLQGFPDNYTEIPWRKKLADQCPDGPRYKALGNSWAVPVVHWIGKRIQAQLDK
jgi:DNA (cytosine-5)-methyltransferase 1